MLDILFWVSIFSGGMLILMLVLSLIGGLDFDFDVDGSDTSIDDGGGLGILKGGLTFLAVASWVFRTLLVYNQPKPVSLIAGIITGAIAVYLMAKLLKILLRQQEDNSWTIQDTVGSDAKVYLRIPSSEGNGIIQVNVSGSIRDIKAKTRGNEIPTGSSVKIIDVENEYVIVE